MTTCCRGMLVTLAATSLLWSSAAHAQLTYPDNQTITESTVVGLKLVNQGSKGVMELVGNYDGQLPVLFVNAATNGAAAVFASLKDGGPHVQISGTCLSSGCTGLEVSTSVGVGVSAQGSTKGVEGSGFDYGVWGWGRDGSDGDGVLGTNTNIYGDGFGVHGINSRGIAGYFESGDSHGAKGFSQELNGLFGDSDSSGASGVYGQNMTGSGYGVAGRTSGGGYAVYGDTGHVSNGYSGYFTGKVTVVGLLAKGGGSFKIDHPLDPENKYLSHSFVESPDMMNVYNGIVTLNAQGTATVQMPNWFSALNRDYRYQLTSIGQFAPVYISTELNSSNQFSIAGGAAGQRISWQITGIRKDAFANQNRVPVEETKTGTDIGRYLHPTAFGQPASKGLSTGMKAKALK